MIRDMRPDASGLLVSNGVYVVRADGNVIVVAEGSSSPEGARYATEGELRAPSDNAVVTFSGDPFAVDSPAATERAAPAVESHSYDDEHE